MFTSIEVAQKDAEPKLKATCPDCGVRYDVEFPQSHPRASGEDRYRGRLVRDMTREELIAALKEMGRLYTEALTADRI